MHLKLFVEFIFHEGHAFALLSGSVISSCIITCNGFLMLVLLTKYLKCCKLLPAYLEIKQCTYCVNVSFLAITFFFFKSKFKCLYDLTLSMEFKILMSAFFYLCLDQCASDLLF